MTFIKFAFVAGRYAIITGLMIFILYPQIANSQTEPLTYPEIITALNSKVPNSIFKNKEEIITFLMDDIRKRKVDKPLAKEIELLLQQSGANAQLIQTIKENSPKIKTTDKTEIEKKENPPKDKTNNNSGDGKDFTFYNKLGFSYYQKGDYDQAIINFTIAVKLNPDFANAYNNRGGAYLKKGDYDQAVIDFSKAIELEPKNAAVAYNNRGSVYEKKGNYDQAISDFTKAVELDSDYVNAYYNRAISYYNKAEYDQAIVDFTKTITLKPNYINAYFSRGATYQKKGENQLAIADYRKVLEMNPNHANAKKYLDILSEKKY